MHINEPISDGEILLPANRAFVVQFKSESHGAGNQFAGRIEHIASGRVELFYSTEEMCRKLKDLLKHQ